MINEKTYDLLKVSTIYKTMLWYCSKRKKNTESKNPTAVKTKNRNCSVCGSKKLKFIK